MTKRALVVVAAIFVTSLVSGAPSALAGGGGCHSPATEAKGNAVEIKDACFTPTNLHVQAGDQVTWVNRDSSGHVVAGTGGTWGRFEELGKGERLTFRFDQPGVYAYTCFLHPGMNGAVIVGKVKTPSSTVEDLGLAAPTEIANPQPPANPVAEPPTSVTTSSSSGPWRAVWLIAIGLLLGAAGTLVTQRLASRRSRLPVAAG